MNLKKTHDETPVNVRMPRPLLDKLQAMAEADDRNLSSMIRVLLSRVVAENEAQPQPPTKEQRAAIRAALIQEHANAIKPRGARTGIR